MSSNERTNGRLVRWALKYVSQAADRQEAYQARKAKPTGLKVNDLVYLYIPRSPAGVSAKLVRKSHGPYRIEAFPSPVNARIRHIHKAGDVQSVHISRLRPYVDYLESARAAPAQPPESPVTLGTEPEPEPDTGAPDALPLADYEAIFGQDPAAVRPPPAPHYDLRPRGILRAPDRLQYP